MKMAPPRSPNRAEHPFVGMLFVGPLVIDVENAPGSSRRGTDPDGHPWATKMSAYYGEIRDTVGSDGDPVDAYVGPVPSDTAYVVHARIARGEGAGNYDEDKVMLNYASEDAALASFRAHYDSADFTGGVSEMTVADLWERLYNGENSVANLPLTLVKADGGAPAGFAPIPGGKHGGFRKPKAGGGYDYWYPEQPDLHPKMEVDPTKRPGVHDLKPGSLVEVGGRRGQYFRWTPNHDHAPEGLTWVTSVNTGAHELVRDNTLFALRPATAARPLPPPPPRPSSGPGAPPAPRLPPPPPGWSANPQDWRKPFTAPPEPRTSDADVGGAEPSGDARRTKKVKDSRAKEGTKHWNLENGVYMTQQIKFRSEDRAVNGVVVPPAEMDDVVREFTGAVRGAAKKVAQRYRIKVADGAGPTAAFEDVLGGARLGFARGLATYTGGSPFIPHIQAYATMYALQAARTELGAGIAIPDRTMRAAAGLFAAKARARARHGGEPSTEQIAEQWSIRKKDVYSGATGLGSYTDAEGKVVDQGEEQVPMGPWKLRAPDGREVGGDQAGKVKLAEKIDNLMQGDKTDDESVLNEHPSMAVLPGVSGAATPAGTALHLREETDAILSGMGEKHRRALELKFGFTTEDGIPASDTDIAETLGISQGKSAVSRRRDAAKLVDEAVRAFKSRAEAKRAEVARHVEAWVRHDSEPLFEDVGGPSLRDLTTRYGSDERARIYLSSVRAGHPARTEAVLLREKEGKATEAESRKIREDHHTQIDRERLDAFRRHSVTIPTEAGRDPLMGNSEYGAHPEDGYMLAMMKRGG